MFGVQRPDKRLIGHVASVAIRASGTSGGTYAGTGWFSSPKPHAAVFGGVAAPGFAGSCPTGPGSLFTATGRTTKGHRGEQDLGTLYARYVPCGPAQINSIWIDVITQCFF